MLSFHLAVQRRGLDPSAERRFINRDRELQPQIAAIQLEVRMGRDLHGDHRVAGFAPHGAGLALAAQPNLLAVFDARRRF